MMNKTLKNIANVISVSIAGILTVVSASFAVGLSSGSTIREIVWLIVAVIAVSIALDVLSAVGLAINKKGLSIAVETLFCVEIALLLIVTLPYGTEFVTVPVLFVPVALQTVALCVPAQAEDGCKSGKEGGAKKQTVEQKVNELKHLKELNVITDEQFSAAVDAIAEEMKKSGREAEPSESAAADAKNETQNARD